MHTHVPDEYERKSMIYNSDEILLLCRDPVTRFISIFNFWFEIYEISKLTRKKTENEKNRLLAHNSLYDKYFDIFKSPNDIAEALTYENKLFHIAVEAISHIAHFKEGMNYYLLDEEIIRINAKKNWHILRIEHHKEDFVNIHKLLFKYNITSQSYGEFYKKITFVTDKTKSRTYLSEKSIKNIKYYYKKDYDIFKSLVKYNIICDKYVNSFIK